MQRGDKVLLKSDGEFRENLGVYFIKMELGWVCWLVLIIPVSERLRQKGYKFENSLYNLAKPCQNK